MAYQRVFGANIVGFIFEILFTALLSKTIYNFFPTLT